VARPEWSALGPDGRARVEPSVALAWERRYAALRPTVEEVSRRTEDGRVPLDADTLLGEVDWAVRQEDCLSAVDFFLRRTDLGYGPLEDLALAQERVLRRMSDLGAWSAERARAEREALEAALSARQAWRGAAERPRSAPPSALKPL
jgi:glycerol-3-phosphate dehydrogenase